MSVIAPKKPKCGGRKKGTPNKITGSMKQALHTVFEKRGGIQALLDWSNDEPTEFYKGCFKLIPQEIAIDPEANKIIVQIQQFTRK